MYKSKKLVSLVLSFAVAVTCFDVSAVKAESSWAAHKTAYVLNTLSGYNYYEPVSHEEGINVKYWKGSYEVDEQNNVSYEKTESDGIEVVTVKPYEDGQETMFEVDVDGMERPVMQIYSSTSKTPSLVVNMNVGSSNDSFSSIVLPYLQEYGKEEDFEAGITPLQNSAYVEQCWFNEILSRSTYDFKEVPADYSTKRYIKVFESISAIYVYDYPKDYVSYNMKVDASKGSFLRGLCQGNDDNINNNCFYLYPESAIQTLQEDNSCRILENDTYEMKLSPYEVFVNNEFADEEEELESGDLIPVTETVTASEIYFEIVGIYDKVKDKDAINLSNITIITSDDVISGDNLKTDIRKGNHNYYFIVSRNDGEKIEINGSLKLNFTISGIDYVNPDVMQPVDDSSTTKPGEGTDTKPGEDTTPGEGTKPGEGTTPGEDTKPDETPVQNDSPLATYPVYVDNATAAPEPTAVPTATPAVTLAPTAVPEAVPTATAVPTVTPAVTIAPTTVPTSTPTVTPLSSSEPVATKEPEVNPTKEPASTQKPDEGTTKESNKWTAPSVTKSIAMKVGVKAQIKVKGSDIKSKTFVSTNKKVATVNKKGVVISKKKGKCNIKTTIKYYKKGNSKKVYKKVFVTKITVK